MALEVPPARRRPWNHNIEYHKVVRAALPPGPLDILDVGCGDGLLSRELARLGHRVIGLDPDQASVSRAGSGHGPMGGIVLGDLLSAPFGPETFHAVVSIAALHHMPEVEALGLMAQLLRPGGTLAVVGLARSRFPRDLPWDAGGAVLTRVLRLVHGGYRPVTNPTRPPASTYRQVRDLVVTALPGVRYRRHVMWRYSLVWKKRPLIP
jgi:2-polyprenyl-3-methyl-5-hydroxy-6-metoxy-1,4-benzoquinol methylase